MIRPMDRGWADWVDDELSEIATAGRWRSMKVYDAMGPRGTLHDHSGAARDVVSFASNDYLGLSHHPKVIAAAHLAIDRWGTGSGASRLIVGTRPIHSQLESAIAEWKHCEAAVVFPTGYAANLGVITTMGVPGVRIFSDELNHASIIDGCRLSGADVCIYRHRDVEHLDFLLDDWAAQSRGRTVVISDSVFSMDGDLARVEDLIECTGRHGSLLILDEAHGVLEPEIAFSMEGGSRVLRMGTLSKTLGSIGGFIAGARSDIDLLVNRARSFIFTTALTPSDAASAMAALEIVCSPEGDGLKERLHDYVQRVRPGHLSPIIPVVLGSENTALSASARLLEAGLWVPAIRPPTVPKGTSRLRIALSASHTDGDIDDLIREIAMLQWNHEEVEIV